MSREELLLRKRLRERERYRKIKEDPIKQELQREKEKRKYENKKIKKQVKKFADMTPREVRLKRKQWRKHANAYYKRKKNTAAMVLPISPPSSDTSDSPQVVSVQRNLGRKRIHRDRNKIINRNRTLLLENARLRSSLE